jgi:hypothetical protein
MSKGSDTVMHCIQKPRAYSSMGKISMKPNQKWIDSLFLYNLNYKYYIKLVFFLDLANLINFVTILR